MSVKSMISELEQLVKDTKKAKGSMQGLANLGYRITEVKADGSRKVLKAKKGGK